MPRRHYSQGTHQAEGVFCNIPLARSNSGRNRRSQADGKDSHHVVKPLRGTGVFGTDPSPGKFDDLRYSIMTEKSPKIDGRSLPSTDSIPCFVGWELNGRATIL